MMMMGKEAIKDILFISLYIVLTANLASSALSSNSRENSREKAALALMSLGVLCSILWAAFQRRTLPPDFPLFGEIPTLLAYKCVPLLGDIPTMLAYRGNLKQMWLDRRQAFGNIFLAQIPFMVVTLGDEEAILWMNDRKHYTEVTWPPSISKLLGPGSLSNATGVHHKTLRRIIEPFFAPNFTRNYVTVIDQTTQQALEEWCCA